jgi:putative nucleotidyltransferase with HDIG domain
LGSHWPINDVREELVPVAEEKCSPKGPPVLINIPVFPPIAIRLLHLVADENVAISEVLELLRSDAAFSAEILRRANSSLFGFSSQISSLQHALVVLGLRRVRALTMTVATGMYLKKALQIGELRRCWRHTLACALLTEELARACSIHLDMAYTAGLLHDVGRLGLLVGHPEEYAAFLRLANERALGQDSYDFLDAEKGAFGLDHCAAGQLLVEQWKLPQEFSLITGRHHDRPYGSEFDLLGLVYLGCQLADAMGFHVIDTRHFLSLEEIRATLPPGAQNRFHTDAEQLRELVERKISSHDIENLGAPPAVADERQLQKQEAEPAPPPAPEPVVEQAARPPQPPEAEKPQKKSTLKRDILAALITILVAGTAFFALLRYLAE